LSPETCDNLIYTSGTIYQIIRETKFTAIQSIDITDGRQSEIFRTKEKIKDSFPIVHDDDWLIFAFKNEAETFKIIVHEMKSMTCTFLAPTLPSDLDQLQDVTVKAGKVVALVRDGWAFLWDAKSGTLIEKIRTKRSTDQLHNRIVKFDPFLSELTLSLIGDRAQLITYKGKDLKNFKVSFRKSLSYNNLKSAKTANNSSTVIHDLVSQHRF
jgi:hypothetical protein